MKLYKKIVLGVVLVTGMSDIAVASFSSLFKPFQGVTPKTKVRYCEGIIAASLLGSAVHLFDYATNSFHGSLNAEEYKKYALKFGMAAGCIAIVASILKKYQLSLMEKDKLRFDVPILAEKVQTSFKDVIGHDVAKKNLQSIVNVFENFSTYLQKNVSVPSALVLHGPGECGKTLLAYALAGETQSTLIDLSSSDIEKAIRNNEKAAIDAIVPEVERCERVFIFLGKLNEFKLFFAERLMKKVCPIMYAKAKPVIVVGEVINKKNIQESLNKFKDEHIHTVFVREPKIKDRKDMLDSIINSKKIASQVDIDHIAKTIDFFSSKRVDFFSYRDLKNLVDRAYYKALQESREYLITKDLDEALHEHYGEIGEYDSGDSYESQIITAYHEAGHALVSILHPDINFSFYKITLKQTLNTLGFVDNREIDKKFRDMKKNFLSKIAFFLGGAAGEEIFNGGHSAGVKGDFELATNTAYGMLAVFGMTDEFGKVAYDFVEIRSNENAQKLVKKILDEQYEVAKNILLENKDKFELLAKTVFEKKVMYAREVHALLGTVDRRFA